MERLEKRIRRLEFQIELLREFIVSDINPFIYLVLETGLTEDQYEAILDLMEETLQGIMNGNPMGHGEFEQRVYEIVPSRRGDYHFAESIVRTLKEGTRWEAVYKHMKKDGMNI